MLVVLDTNIIFSNFRFTGILSRTLLEACLMEEETDIRLGLPRVVLEEVKNNFRKELEKSLARIRKAVQDLEQQLAASKRVLSEEQQLINLDYQPLTEEIVAEIDKEYRTFLEELTTRVGVNVLPYPLTSAEVTIEREMAKLRPFGREHPGYKDFFIWETILEALQASDDDVVFITDNYRDFTAGRQDEQQSRLHPDFVEDLRQRGIAPTRLTLYRSLDEFVNGEIMPTLDSLDPAYVLDTRFDFRSRMDEEIAILLEKAWFDNEAIGLRPEFEDPHVIAVEGVANLEVIGLKRLPTDELIVSVEADVNCELDVFVERSSWYEIEEEHGEEISDLDEEWNETYVQATIRRLVHLSLKIIMNNKSGRIAEIETQPITPSGPIRHKMVIL